MQPQTLRNDNFGFLPNHSSYGVASTDLDGALFNVNVAVSNAFTLNRAPSKSVEATPYELWFGKKPKLSFLKVWDCDAYVKKLQPDKLEPKSEKCVFIGYQRKLLGTPSITDLKARFSLLKSDPF